MRPIEGLGAAQFEETGYDPAAAVYDLEYPDCEGDELAFWSQLADAAGPQLLELATGTGRVAIALAGLGHQVIGLDRSSAMLVRAERKRRRLAPGVAARLRLVRADMRAFHFATPFDVVFVSFNSYLLLDAAGRLACLRAAHRQLRPGGAFAVDVFAANQLDRTPDHEQMTFLETEPETGRRVTRERFYEFDPASDRGLSTLVYRLCAPDGSVEELRLGYSLALMAPEDVVGELEAADLAVEGVYGGYRREPWTASASNLIVVGRKLAR
jgi:SAM-dependent methyltransferase